MGAIEQVAFNNLRCTMLNGGAAPGMGGVGAAAPPPVPAAAQAPVSPTDLQIEYTPIEVRVIIRAVVRPSLADKEGDHTEVACTLAAAAGVLPADCCSASTLCAQYLGQPIVSTFTQFLVR